MQKHVVLVSAAAVLGIAAVVLGIVASNKSKGFVSPESFHEQRCVYRRKPALGYGIAGALLALTGVSLATMAIGPDAPATGRTREIAVAYCIAAWVTVASAVVVFLYGAALKRGHSTKGWHGRAYYYGCTELKSGIFDWASTLSAVATWYAITAYYKFQLTDEDEPAPGQFVEPGVEMGQPQWAQPYPPPPMANPAPPQYGHGVEMGQPVMTQAPHRHAEPTRHGDEKVTARRPAISVSGKELFTYKSSSAFRNGNESGRIVVRVE